MRASLLIAVLVLLAIASNEAKPSPTDAIIQQIYTLPFQGVSVKTCGFQYYSQCNSNRPGFHYGTDYALGSTPLIADHPVAAAAKGTVKKCPDNGTAGNTIVIDHGGGHRTRYLHMDRFAASISNGQTVARGQVIGFEGDSGDSDGVHLHLETRHGATTFTCGFDGTNVDPYAGPYSPGTYMWRTDPPSMGMDMDFSGDGNSDVLARQPNGVLCMFKGTGTGIFQADGIPSCGDGTQIGTGWQVFNWLLRPGDFNGDGCHDIVVRENNWNMTLYAGNCVGSASYVGTIGTGWSDFNWLLAPGDINGDGFVDIVARQTSNGDLCLLAGNGSGGFITNPDPPCYAGTRIGTGWNVFSRLADARDFSGGGCMDILGQLSDGATNLYASKCMNGFNPNDAFYPANYLWNWASFETLLGSGDFTGDICPDILARKWIGSPDFYRFRGSCFGSVTSNTGFGFGWWAFDRLF